VVDKPHGRGVDLAAEAAQFQAVRRREDVLIIDADYEVVSGPYRFGEEHRSHPGWYFIGRYDAEGWPLFISKPAPFHKTLSGRTLIGIGALLALVVGGSVFEIYVFEPLFAHHPIAPAASPPSAQPARLATRP
jgi:hypothetical protein